MSRTLNPFEHQTADLLGDDAIRNLRPRVPGAPDGGVIAALFLGLLSFGILPALLWPFHFAGMVQRERANFMQLTQWVQLRFGQRDSARLQNALLRIRFRPLFYLLAGVSCGMLVLAFLFAVRTQAVPLTQETVVRSTYWHVTVRNFAPSAYQTLFYAWSFYLSAAYLAHWAQVQLYARSVRRFLNEFNEIAMADALRPVYLRPLGVGLRPMWLVGAAILLTIQAPWGIAMMLAGAVQRRYTAHSGPDARAALACRLKR